MFSPFKNIVKQSACLILMLLNKKTQGVEVWRTKGVMPRRVPCCARWLVGIFKERTRLVDVFVSQRDNISNWSKATFLHSRARPLPWRRCLLAAGCCYLWGKYFFKKKSIKTSVVKWGPEMMNTTTCSKVMSSLKADEWQRARHLCKSSVTAGRSEEVN